MKDNSKKEFERLVDEANITPFLVQILINGKLRMSFSVKSDPKDSNETIELLEEVIRALKAPPVEDKELFPDGKYTFS